MPEEELEDNAGQAEPTEEVQSPPDSGDASQSTEAGTQEEATSPLAGLEADAIAALPEVSAIVKSVEARLGESFRQRTETERARAQREADSRAYQEQLTRASQADVNWAHQQLFTALRGAQDSGEALDPARISTVAQQLEERARLMHVQDLDRYAPSFIAQSYPEFRVPPDYVDALAAARNRGDVRGILQAIAAQVALAQHERSSKWAVAEYEKEQAQKAKGETETAEARKLSSERKAAPRPSAVPGRTSANGMRRMSLDEIERMPMSEWDAIPAEQRKRLLDDAHAAARS